MSLADLETWNNQESDNQNLEALSILIQQLLTEIKALEARIVVLEP